MNLKPVIYCYRCKHWIGPEYRQALAGTAACLIPVILGLIWAAWYAHGPDIDPKNWNF